MTPSATIITLTVVGCLCVYVGLKGIVGSTNTAQRDGPNTLMHYPAPLPWLRRKVTAARWVKWIGRIYFSAGLASLFGAWVLLTADPNVEKSRKCDQLAETIRSFYPAALQGGKLQSSHPPNSCRTQILDQKRVRWFDVSSTAPQHGLGQEFLQERQKLSRLSYTITPIEGIGSRAALARGKHGSSLNPIVFFTDETGSHKIELNSLVITPDAQVDFVTQLKQSLRPRGLH